MCMPYNHLSGFRGIISDGLVYGIQAICADECWDGAGLAPWDNYAYEDVCKDNKQVHLGPGPFNSYPLGDSPAASTQQPFVTSSCPGASFCLLLVR